DAQKRADGRLHPRSLSESGAKVRLRMRRWQAILLLAFAACRGGKVDVPSPEPGPPPAAVRGEPASERRPDPAYPTARAAGTEELFLLEEPPRGPHVTDVKLPDRSQLKFTEHTFCELTQNRLVCSAARPKNPALHWNVGRAG